MGWHACSRPLLHAGFAAGLIACAAPFAMADEASYCVICKGPDQTYVCRVTGEGSRPSDALKLYCVIRTAKEGNHASCSAERGSPACNGVEKVYSYDGPLMPPDLAADPRVKRLMDKAGQDQQAFAKPKGDAPKTLVELTGRAVNASRQGWRNARSAIGGGGEAQPLPAPSEAPLPTAESAAADSTSAPPPSRVQRAKHAAQNAGSAVGGFARKSYRCVRSFFRKCSGETADGQALQ
jgi:hypothetical protein